MIEHQVTAIVQNRQLLDQPLNTDQIRYLNFLGIIALRSEDDSVYGKDAAWALVGESSPKGIWLARNKKANNYFRGDGVLPTVAEGHEAAS